MPRSIRTYLIIIVLFSLLSSCKSEWKLEYTYDWLKIKSYEMFNGMQIFFHQSENTPNTVTHVVCYKHNATTAKEVVLAKTLKIYASKMINSNISSWEQDLYLQQQYKSPLNSSCFHANIPSELLPNWLLLEHKRMTRLVFSNKLFRESVSELYQQLQDENENPLKSIDYIISKYLDKKHPTLANKLLELQRISISNLASYYKKIYSPENAFFIVSGSIKENKYKQLIAKIFGGVNKKYSSLKVDEINFSNRPIAASPVSYSLSNSVFPYIVWQWPAFTVIDEKSFNKRIASLLVFNDLLTNPTIGLFNHGIYFSDLDVIDIKSSYSDDYYFAQPHQALLTVRVTLDPDRVKTTKDLIKIVQKFEYNFNNTLLDQISESHVAILKQNQFFKFQRLNRDGTESLKELLPQLITANADTESIQNILKTVSEVTVEDIWLIAQYFTKTKPYIYTFIPKQEK